MRHDRCSSTDGFLVLLTISTSHNPATDLGFLLHKHPGRLHEVPLSFGVARVVYPEASEERCMAALLVDVDPVGLVRDRKGGPRGRDGSLEQYVNDRPYATSSFLSVALGKVFGTALSGRSKDRPELVDAAWPLEAHLPALPCRGGEAVLRRLFEPLGYEVTALEIPLDATFPAWGSSAYFDVWLRGTQRVQEFLQHVFVLLPVLDDDKHYWVGDEEVDKLAASWWRLALDPPRQGADRGALLAPRSASDRRCARPAAGR